jgi:predicted nuclease with TOPRIM domain
LDNDVAAIDQSVPLFGARKKARELAVEVADLRAQLQCLGGLSVIELEEKSRELGLEVDEQRQVFETERQEIGAQLEQLKMDVVETGETALLQEAGVYEYRHPLDDSVQYKDALDGIREQIKAMTKKDGGAVRGNTNWQVNGSAAQGRTMVRDFSKLMLRAYNAEADNLARGMKPYKLDSSIQRLTKVAATIAKLGTTMDIHISGQYHELREFELQLTADYREKQAEEKEREREEKARLREEREAQKEMERERSRLEKEQAHYLNSIEKLRVRGDAEAVARLEGELKDIERAIEDVDYRAANIRAGYVYVISNIGSFCEGVVKVGLTRRLDPQVRVRELGDASVPFRFDTHALVFSEDAVGLEAHLHKLMEDKRVNRINLRREFFYATPEEVKAHLVAVAGDILTFTDTPEAAEFHQSRHFAKDLDLPEGPSSSAEPSA